MYAVKTTTLGFQSVNPFENFNATVPITSEMILSLIRGDSIMNQKTVFITTHDERILNIANRVIQVKENMNL